MLDGFVGSGISDGACHSLAAHKCIHLIQLVCIYIDTRYIMIPNWNAINNQHYVLLITTTIVM